MESLDKALEGPVLVGFSWEFDAFDAPETKNLMLSTNFKNSWFFWGFSSRNGMAANWFFLWHRPSPF